MTALGYREQPQRCDYCRWSLELHHPDCPERTRLSREPIPEGSISAPKLQDGPGSWGSGVVFRRPAAIMGFGREPGMIDPEDGGIWLQRDEGFLRRCTAGVITIRREYFRAARSKGWKFAGDERDPSLIRVERRG